MINIKQILFTPLKEDYEAQKGIIKFQLGLDYMESMVKFFGFLAMLNEIDDELIHKIKNVSGAYGV